MVCKNCGEDIQGNYCSNCGQRSKVDAITFSSLMEELSNSIFQINHGLFYTLKMLFVRPGASVREYLAGKRKRYFKPIAYVLTLSTFYYLISQLTGQNTWMDDFISGFVSGGYESKEKQAIPGILLWFSKNFAYSTLLLLPVYSFASYIAFIGKGRNYLEHIVISSYITGQQAIFYTFFIVLKSFVKSDIIEVFPVIAAFVYAVWFYGRFFEKGNRWSIHFRSILTYLLYLLFSFGALIFSFAISKMM